MAALGAIGSDGSLIPANVPEHAASMRRRIGEERYGRHRTARLYEGRDTGCARLHGGRLDRHADAAAGTRGKRAVPHAQGKRSRDHRVDGRDAGAGRARSRHRAFHRSADCGAAGGGVAAGAHHEREAAICEPLSRRRESHRRGERQNLRAQVRDAVAERQARFRQRDAAEQGRRLAGPAGAIHLCRAAQRRGRRRVRTMEGYEALGVPYMAHIAPDRRW